MTMGSGGVFGDPNRFFDMLGQRKGGLFGHRAPLPTMQSDPENFMPLMDAGTQQAVQQYATMPKRGGLFGSGFADTMNNLAGGLAKAQAYIDGDWGAAQSIQTPADLQKQAELLRAQSLQKQGDQWDLWVRQQEYERANPKPAAPNDTERDYSFMVQTVGKEAADNWLRRRGDPLVNMTLPNGQFYSGPASQLPQALGGAQQPARKTIGGKTYEQRNGTWFEVDGGQPGGGVPFPVGY
jgi:hypothetical protein